ncbi:MAG: hypothetical protein IT196_28125 [Acidimicrobiales bacterium]|nr:hypothetical protein [Acidimicrobiales bacterium]
MTAPNSQCSWAMAVLLAPGDHDDAAVLLARAHAGRCLRCAEVLEDDGAADRVLEQLQSRRPAAHTAARALLAVVAIAQLAVAVPWLFGFNVLSSIGGAVATSHLTRDGALGVAVGAAGLFTVWRPSFSRAMVLVCTVPMLVQLVSSLADSADAQVGFRVELVHLVTPLVVVLAMIVGRPPKAPTADRRPPAPLRSLR